MKESRLPAVRISGLICRKAVPLSVLPLTKNISVTLFYLIRLGNQPPVTVKITDGSAEITVLLGIKYGYKAQVCAENVQESIKSSVQDMTGIMVSKVNVKIISLL